MNKEIKTVNDAAHEWVQKFNAVPQGMIYKLMEANPDDWTNVTAPSRNDRVYVFEVPEEFDTDEDEGKIVGYDTSTGLYSIEMDDGVVVTADTDSFDVLNKCDLPMWGTMWSFGDSCDDWWLEEDDGIRKMSECGFSIYHSEEFGYWFGIDGAGYDFYTEHWIPLYKARGLHWHDDKAEREYQMRKKGYEQKLYCNKQWWFCGDVPVEEVQS